MMNRFQTSIVFAKTLFLFIGLFPATSKAQMNQTGWWTDEPATLTINGKSTGFSYLTGVLQIDDKVCAIKYSSFMGHETAYLFKGTTHRGHSELAQTKRLRGGMTVGPAMELYSGLTGIAQKIYVGQNNEPRVFFLTTLQGPVDARLSSELSSVCAE